MKFKCRDCGDEILGGEICGLCKDFIEDRKKEAKSEW